jgi:multidrug efflux pump subunit AcrA (membrane-fusion protein)
MLKRIVILGLCAAIGGGGVAAWRVQGASPTPQTQPPAPAVPVVAEKVQVSHVPLVRSGIGTVMPYNVVDIHTQVTGTIDKIGFVEGQTVHPSSLIACATRAPSRQHFSKLNRTWHATKHTSPTRKRVVSEVMV